MPPLFELRCFGSPGLFVHDEGRERLLLPPGKPLLILAHLDTRAPRAVSRSALATIVWPDADESQGRASLRQALYRLRQILGPELLVADDHAVRLAAPLPGDVARLNAALAADDDLALVAMTTVDFLEGVSIEGSDWLEDERHRWRQLGRDARLRQGKRHLLVGEREQGVELFEQALSRDEDHADAWIAYLTALRDTEQRGRLSASLARLEAAGRRGTITSFDWSTLQRRFATPPVSRVSGIDPDALALPLTGREPLLQHLLARAGGGTSAWTVTALLAAPGFGKTRLLRELMLRLEPTGPRCLYVTALAAETSTAWSLYNRIVDVVAAHAEASGIAPEHAAELIAVNPALSSRFPGTAPRFGASADTTRLAEALHELLAVVGEEDPFVLVIDDLHWGDSLSNDALARAFSMRGGGEVRGVVATRTELPLAARHWTTLHLPTFAEDDLATLLAARFPSARELPTAARHLMTSTAGIPLYVARAMQRLQAAPSIADDDLLERIERLEPTCDPVYPARNDDRAILGYLAIAGDVVDDEELATAARIEDPIALEPHLVHLSREGWIAQDGRGWRLAHDLLRAQAIGAIAPAERKALTDARARWLTMRGTTFRDLQAALRLHLESSPRAAVAAVREWRRRFPDAPRGRALVDPLLPPDVPASIRFRALLAATPHATTVLALVASIVALGLWTVNTWARQPVALYLENVPRVPPVVTEEGQRVLRNIVPPQLTARDRFGRISNRLDGESVHIARLIGGVDSARLVPAPVFRAGRVTLSSLEIFSHSTDSQSIAFRAGSLPPITIPTYRGLSSLTLAIQGGWINGRSIDALHPELTVRAGDSLIGTIRLQYTTPVQAALWMLAETSTMHPASKDTTTIVTLHTGAIDAVTEFLVRRRAPDHPGVHWIVWVSGPEPGATWLLSLTNWRCGAPRWNDGNDFLNMTDSMFASAGRGATMVRRVHRCDASSRTPILGEGTYAVAALRVTVTSAEDRVPARPDR